MYTLYTASSDSCSQGVIGEWESISKYERIQYEKNKNNYRKYFDYSEKNKLVLDFDDDLIREYDKRRVRLSRKEVDELLDLENSVSEIYFDPVNFEEIKHFKPIRSSSPFQSIHEKETAIPLFISDDEDNKTTIKSQTGFGNEKLKFLKKSAKIFKDLNKRKPKNENIKEKSKTEKERNSQDFEKSSETNEDKTKSSLNEIFMNFFLMNSFLTLDKDGCFKLSQYETYELFKTINKTLKMGNSNEDINKLIKNLTREENCWIDFNSFEASIIKSLMKKQNIKEPSNQMRSSMIPEEDGLEEEELSNMDSKKPENTENNRSIGFKIAFVNLFLANSLVSLDMSSECRISKKGAYNVLQLLNERLCTKFSDRDLQILVDKLDETNDNYIDFSEFKKMIVRIVSK